MKLFMKYVFFIFLFSVVNALAFAQTKSDLDKIEASQGAASPLLFTAKSPAIPLLNGGDFYSEIECNERTGMPNFFNKIKEGKPVSVVFVGGSITQSAISYRQQVAKYLENTYPQISFKWVNAGVSGTGTELAAFRFQEHVLNFKPDLVFLEFAVNRAYAEGMEGLIRKLIKHNPQTDICLLYTAFEQQIKDYAAEIIPPNVKGLERVAEYYQVPSVIMALEAAKLEKEGKVVWKAPTAEAGKILFSNDGLHPILSGGNLYAQAIIRGFEKMKNNSKPFIRTLKTPLISDLWDNAQMYNPDEVAKFSEEWQTLTSDDANFPFVKRFSTWFDKIYFTNKPGAKLEFRFEGDMFGIFDIGGPEVGQLEIKINGEPVKLKLVAKSGVLIQELSNEGDELLNRFTKFSNNRYRGQHDVISVPYGTHKVEITLSEKKADKTAILKPALDDITANPEKYSRTDFYLGKILIRGKILK